MWGAPVRTERDVIMENGHDAEKLRKSFDKLRNTCVYVVVDDNPHQTPVTSCLSPITIRSADEVVHVDDDLNVTFLKGQDCPQTLSPTKSMETV
jgi:hypothetical protein